MNWPSHQVGDFAVIFLQHEPESRWARLLMRTPVPTPSGWTRIHQSRYSRFKSWLLGRPRVEAFTRTVVSSAEPFPHLMSDARARLEIYRKEYHGV